MRVALITLHECPGAPASGGGVGGLATYVRCVSEAFAQHGISVDVYTANHGECHYDEATTPRNLQTHHIATHRTTRSKRDFYDSRLQFAAAVQQRFAPSGRPYDIVYSHYWISGLIGERLSRTWGVPHAMTFHTVQEMKRDASPTQLAKTRQTTETVLAHSVDAILTSSSDETGFFMTKGVPEKRLHIAPPGVDTRLFRPMDRNVCRQRLRLPMKDPIVLWVGRLNRDKGLEDLLCSMALMRDTGVQLVVVGGNARDPYRRQLSELTRQLELTANITFIDAQDHINLPYFYASADAFVLPSHHETYGLAALEAGACGTPVIATRVGGLQFCVADNRTGLLVSPHAPEEIASAIRRLVQDKRFKERLGTQARSASLARDWSRTVVQHEHVLRLAAQRPRRKRAAFD